MNETIYKGETQQAAVTGLAVVGFVALVGAGMWLAVYSTRYVPSVVGRIGAAAVYLGSVFTPASGPTLSVIPTASTTIPFGEATSTEVIPTPPQTSATTVHPTAGEKTETISPLNGNVSPLALSGLPDLVVTITAVGYLTTPSADSFVASSTVPVGVRPAVSFIIKNNGTNVSGPWRFSASIPTQSSFVYQSQAQQPLNPGDSIEYTLGFDQATPGVGKMVSITANFDHAVGESNENNNSASAQLTILGG